MTVNWFVGFYHFQPSSRFLKVRDPNNIKRGLPASYLPIVDLEECHIDFQAQVPVAGLILQEEDVPG